MEKPLLLLHGAIGAKDQLNALSHALRPDFSAAAINFSGHGGEPQREEKLSIRLFAEDVLRWLDENGHERAPIFGFSMGGYVGLYLALHYPDRVERLATLGTKLAWSPETATREAGMLNPDKLQEKVPAFARQLEERHRPHNWKVLLGNTAAMLQELGQSPAVKTEELRSIKIPVLLCIGDHDNMVTIEETLQAYRTLEAGSLLVLPDTIHPLEKLRLEIFLPVLLKFFN